MKRIKCITFDKNAQDNLPEDIKAKMKADREKAKEQIELSTATDSKPPVNGNNCEQCAFFKYKASWGHGWCYNDNSQYSGKLRGNGKSCSLNTLKF